MGFLLRHLPVVFLIGGILPAATWMIEKTQRVQKTPMGFETISDGLSAGTFLTGAVFTIALLAASVVGLGLSLRCGRNMLPAAMQMACYLAGYLVAFALGFAAAFLLLVASGEDHFFLEVIARMLGMRGGSLAAMVFGQSSACSGWRPTWC